MVIVKDPATGRTWPSPEAYVRDPRKYGGGGGSSGRTFREEFQRLEAIKKEAARKAAELEAVKKAAELKAKIETQQATQLRARQEAIEAEETRKRARTVDYWIEQGLSAGASRILAEKIRAGKYEEANKIIGGINRRKRKAWLARVAKAAEEHHREKYIKPFLEKREEEIARKKWEKEHPVQAWFGATWLAAKEKYFKAATWTKEKITEPYIFKPGEKIGITKESYGKALSYTFIGSALLLPTPSFRKATAEWGMGFYKGAREKPLKTAATTAAFFVLPGMLGIGGKAIEPIAATFPTTTKVLGTGLKIGLPALYSWSVGKRIYEEEAGLRMEKFGEISATEIIPMIVGGYAGAKFWPRVEGYIRTIGRKEIQIEKLVPKEVLTGKKAFPMAPHKKHLKLFKEKPYVYHATQKEWTKFITQPGQKELPGTYVAYKVSPHFLKVQKGYTVYGGKLFEPYGTPTVMKIYPRGYKITKWARIPGVPKTPLGYKWLAKSKYGYAEIPLMKSEVEALMRPGTKLLKTTVKEFFVYKGYKIPLDVFKIAGKESITKFGKTIKTFTQWAYSYKTPSKYPVTTPGSYGILPLVSAKPSVLDYDVAPPSSYIPSITSPSLISHISYTPSKPSYVPSIISYAGRPTPPSKYISPPPSRVPPTPPSIFYKSKIQKYLSLPKSIITPPPSFFYPAKRIKRFGMQETEALMREPSIFMPGFTARAFRMEMGISMKELTRLAKVPEMAIGIRKIPVFPSLVRRKRKKRRVQDNLNLLLRL